MVGIDIPLPICCKTCKLHIGQAAQIINGFTMAAIYKCLLRNELLTNAEVNSNKRPLKCPLIKLDEGIDK